MFSKKATKMDEIFTVDLTVTTYCQIDGEIFINFCGLSENVNIKWNSISSLIFALSHDLRACSSRLPFIDSKHRFVKKCHA